MISACSACTLRLPCTSFVLSMHFQVFTAAAFTLTVCFLAAGIVSLCTFIFQLIINMRFLPALFGTIEVLWTSFCYPLFLTSFSPFNGWQCCNVSLYSPIHRILHMLLMNLLLNSAITQSLKKEQETGLQKGHAQSARPRKHRHLSKAQTSCWYAALKMKQHNSTWLTLINLVTCKEISSLALLFWCLGSLFLFNPGNLHIFYSRPPVRTAV